MAARTVFSELGMQCLFAEPGIEGQGWKVAFYDCRVRVGHWGLFFSFLFFLKHGMIDRLAFHNGCKVTTVSKFHQANLSARMSPHVATHRPLATIGLMVIVIV